MTNSRQGPFLPMHFYIIINSHKIIYKNEENMRLQEFVHCIIIQYSFLLLFILIFLGVGGGGSWINNGSIGKTYI